MPAISAGAEPPAFQDLIPGNFCYGCGPGNPQGLHIRSHWVEGNRARCRFRPQAHHCAGSPRYVNGGLIATLMDCHAVCTAMAGAYRQAGREIGAGEPLNYVTAALEVSFRRPTPVDSELTVEAAIVEAGSRKTVLDCELAADGVVCATGRVVAVRVANGW